MDKKYKSEVLIFYNYQIK